MRTATSYDVLSLLSGDMDDAEQGAVWTLVRYLREKEITRGEACMEQNTREAEERKP
jgi:hypothetical protein